MLSKNLIKYILVAIFIFLIGFGVGYQKGARDTLHLGLQVVFALMEKQKISVDVDTEMIENAILQYKNNIAGCLFVENASIYRD